MPVSKRAAAVYPTRTRGGGYPRIGISETELESMKGLNGDVYKPKDLLNGGDKEARQTKAVKMAEGRTGGVLPEQNTNPIVDRHQRRSITDKEARTRGVGFAPVTEWNDDDEGVAAIGGKPAHANTSQVRTDNGEAKQAKAANDGYHGDAYKLPDAKDNTWTWQQAEEGMKRFNGNVDLYNRPVVNADAMAKAGYNIPAGNTATVYSMQRGIRDKDGKIREVLYTPITATGEVMSQKDIDAYIDSLDGADDILAADKARKGMIIHLDADPSGNDGQELHLMQEAYGKKPKVMRMAGANDVDEDVNDGRAIDRTTTQDVPKVDSYEKMLEFLKAQQVADADADRRARRMEMMAAIGDGISAISSLYQTTQGAPVTYTPGRDMSEAMRQRYDRLTAQRKADSDKYLNYLRVQQAREQAEENQEYRRQMAEYRQQQLDETARSNKEREETRKETLRLQKEREERISKAQDLNIEMKKAKDPGLRIYYGTKAERIADGWPEEKAEAYALAAQEEYNQQQKAQEAARKAAQKRTRSRSRRRTSSGSSSGSKRPYGTAPGGL